MKYLVLAGIIIAAAGGLVAQQHTTGATATKVTICHFDRNDTGPNAGSHTIEVDENAVAGHLENHTFEGGYSGSDYLGACEGDPTATPTEITICETSPTPSSFTPTNTSTPSSTSTATYTATSSATLTPIPPSITPTLTPTPTDTPSPTRTQTLPPTRTPTATSTPTASATTSSTATQTSTPTASNTSTPTTTARFIPPLVREFPPTGNGGCLRD